MIPCRLLGLVASLLHCRNAQRCQSHTAPYSEPARGYGVFLSFGAWRGSLFVAADVPTMPESFCKNDGNVPANLDCTCMRISRWNPTLLNACSR